MRFDRIAVLDWSAAARPRTGKDSIWLGIAGNGEVASINIPTRGTAEARLHGLVRESRGEGRRLLIGADFAFGFPAGLAAAISGRDEALAMWEWLADRVEDGPDNRNNRFAVAAEMNRALPGLGPFWWHPPGIDLPELPLKGTARAGHGLPDLRQADRLARGAQSVWKLGTAGAVGSQVLTGLPVLWRLRAAFPGSVAVWPFEDCRAAAVVLAEVFPSLLRDEIAALVSLVSLVPPPDRPVRDEVQVLLLSLALDRLSADDVLATLFAAPPRDAPLAEEGWILGVGQEQLLRAAAQDVSGAVLRRRPSCDNRPMPR